MLQLASVIKKEDISGKIFEITGPRGPEGRRGPKGERGFRGEEGKVVSKAQVNNQLLSGIYEELLKIGGVGKEDYSNRLEPFNNPNYE